MLRSLGNQKGNIALAAALVVFSLMSAITMSMLAYKDTIDARLDFDALQEVLFLRSEAARGQSIVQNLDYTGDGFYVPVKHVTIAGSHSKNTYTLKSRVLKENVSTGGGLYFTQGYNIKSLVTVKRGISALVSSLENVSMVRKYGEKNIRRTSFAGYHYFTDNESSSNNTDVYFYGPDHIYGKVHSNTNIHIKDLNGWPTFYGTVYTSGVIVPHNGTPDYQQVFQAGYFEHVGQIEFNPTATQIRSHGIKVNGLAEEPNKISYVILEGNSYRSYIGNIVTDSIDTTDVWTQYPPPAGQYLFRNRFARYDTIWSTGRSGSNMNSSSMVYHKLWIDGRVSGHQTWCSSDTMFINGDLLYTGTDRGYAPDQPGTLNTTDMAGYVSEKSIIIKYGFLSPADTLRHRNTSGNDANGVFIYGALCALGDGNGNSHKDGVFSFEYQHPHPSTPDVRLGTNPHVWDKIDLHRYRFPNTHWPQFVDYPWYNPLWPEQFPYMERGSIHLYGSVAQKRRGYVHRSTNDSEYPNNGNIWNIPIDFCGGTSGTAVNDPILNITGQGINYPGATGGGVGYKKDYHFDNRLSFASPPDYPEVHISGGFTPFESEIWTLKRPPRDL